MNKIKDFFTQSTEDSEKQEKKTEENPIKKARTFKGLVISDKMDKTVSVLINRYKEHPKYKKRYRISKKYLADNPKNEYKIGDQVIIQEIRPMSKNKKWRVLSRISSRI